MSIAKTVNKNLLVLGRAYAKATGSSLAKVGREMYGRASFFADLRRGRNLSTKNIDAILTRFARTWPEGLPWPALDPVQMRPAGKVFPMENS